MPQKLETIDNVRRKIAPKIEQSHKAKFGQFMTPSNIASYMASLFPPTSFKSCHLLDAGAGIGVLSCAFLDRCLAGDFSFASIDVTAYEIDDLLREHLTVHLAQYENITPHVIAGDYIKLATENGIQDRGYTHVILNPPYKKINSQSAHRLALRSVGIETVNMYSAFVALSLAETAPNGEVVAIIPRSFCNGPYYQPFREFILERAAIQHMHLFNARNKAFKDDEVLQESIIIHLKRGGKQGPVTVSTSTDDSFSDLVTHTHPFDRIVFPDDAGKFIHVPTSPEHTVIERSPAISHTLADLGLQVSTGPVVDFRVKAHLRAMPEAGSVPLLYPAHFHNSGTVWPLENFKKFNAIMLNPETEKWLYPSGFYCAVRRFSSKEEKRRVIASVIEPTALDSSAHIGIENHLNVFHIKKQGLDERLARGLAVFLNTTAVDEHFRKFSGHTQVNATDLRLMKYPSSEALKGLGQWAAQQKELTQASVDVKFKELIA